MLSKAVALLTCLLVLTTQSTHASGATSLVKVFDAEVDLLSGRAIVNVPLSTELPAEVPDVLSLHAVHGVSMDSTFVADYSLPLSLTKGSHSLGAHSVGDSILEVTKVRPGVYAIKIQDCEGIAQELSVASSRSPIIFREGTSRAIVATGLTAPGGSYSVTLIGGASKCDPRTFEIAGPFFANFHLTPTGSGALLVHHNDAIETIGSLSSSPPTVRAGDFIVGITDTAEGLAILTRSQSAISIYLPALDGEQVFDIRNVPLLSSGVMSPDGERVATAIRTETGSRFLVWEKVGRTASSVDYGSSDGIAQSIDIPSIAPYVYVVGAGNQFNAAKTTIVILVEDPQRP